MDKNPTEAPTNPLTLKNTMRFTHHSISALALLIMFFNVSCSTEEDLRFEGKIVQSCEDDSPVAGINVEMYFLKKSNGLGGASGRSFSYNTETGSDGQFQFDFEEKEWDLAAEGTFGAELIVDGQVILQGIAPGSSTLGTVIKDFQRTVPIYAQINGSELMDSDTLYINFEYFSTGNFSIIQDTITGQLISNSPGDRYAPIFNETRFAEFSWQIRAADAEIINAREEIDVDGECAEGRSYSFTISRN